MKRLFLILAILSLVSCKNETAFLFSYFDNTRQAEGLLLAYSYDGYNWTPLNDNKSVLAPNAGREKLMRDPSICQGPDGTFHMVWTTSWWDENSIGYASSPDLIHWSEQQTIPVMKDYPSVQNCWAPELFYNKEEGVFYIMWASIVMDNDYVDRSGSENEDGGGHRIYCTTTTDFKTFTPSRIYFNNPYASIDAAVAQDPITNEYIMVIKDDPVYVDMHATRTASMAEGFPTKMVSAISDSDNKEGPSPLFINDTDLLVFFDYYFKHQIGAYLSRDHGDTWTNVSDQINMPEGMSHGTALRVDRKVIDKLIEAYN